MDAFEAFFYDISTRRNDRFGVALLGNPEYTSVV